MARVGTLRLRTLMLRSDNWSQEQEKQEAVVNAMLLYINTTV